MVRPVGRTPNRTAKPTKHATHWSRGFAATTSTGIGLLVYRCRGPALSKGGSWYRCSNGTRRPRWSVRPDREGLPFAVLNELLQLRAYVEKRAHARGFLR